MFDLRRPRRVTERKLRRTQVRRCEEVISRSMYEEGREADYEGLNCDWCGAAMHVGDTRWVITLLRKESFASDGYNWYFCSCDCEAHGRMEVVGCRRRP